MDRCEANIQSQPKLGVVVPVRNAASTIQATLLGLASGINCIAKVIVVDGCSTDGTPAIAASMGFEVIQQPCSLYEALNIGFQALSHEWLTWINADDILYTDSLPNRLLDAARADLLYGAVDFIDSQTRFVHCWHSAAPRDLLRLFRAGYSPMLQPGTLFRRALFEQAGGFLPHYSLVADADFWYRCLELGARAVRSNHPPVAAFRLRREQLSRVGAAEMVSQHAAMTASNGGQPGKWHAFMPLVRLRAGNWRSYAMRALRRFDLEGQVRLKGSYDLPSSACSSPT